MFTVNDKLKLLALDTDAFVDGISNILKFYISKKDSSCHGKDPLQYKEQRAGGAPDGPYFDPHNDYLELEGSSFPYPHNTINTENDSALSKE